MHTNTNELKECLHNINCLLISHGWGAGTQFLESLFDNHPEIIQFPTNYLNYFSTFKGLNFTEDLENFVNFNGGYVYGIFEGNKRGGGILPLWYDRGGIILKNNNKNELINKFIILNKNIVFKNRFELFSKLDEFTGKKNTYEKLRENIFSIYSIDKNKFVKISIEVFNKIEKEIKYNKKNFILLMHISLAKYYKKDLSKIKYFCFNLHDYTNYDELITDFPNLYNFTLARDIRTKFYRNLVKKYGVKQGIIEFALNMYKNIFHFNKMNQKLKQDRSFVLFLEDLNFYKEKCINKIAKILKIQFSPNLLEATFGNGKTNWGNSTDKQSFGTFRNDLEKFDYTKMPKHYINYLNHTFPKCVNKNIYKAVKLDNIAKFKLIDFYLEDWLWTYNKKKEQYFIQYYFEKKSLTYKILMLNYFYLIIFIETFKMPITFYKKIRKINNLKLTLLDLKINSLY